MTSRKPVAGIKSYYERMIPKHKGRFARLPRALIDTALFRDFGGDAVKVLWYLAGRYFPNNNGMIEVYPKEHMQWGLSKHCYSKALAELKAKNLVFQTNKPEHTVKDCFALTWLPVMNPLPPYLSVAGLTPREWKETPFARLPIDLINTGKFAKLSGDAIKLATYMVSDWRESKGVRARGFTLNGYLQCSHELKSTPKAEQQAFRNRGFTEKRLIKARQKLLDAGFIVRTYEHKPQRPKDLSCLYTYKAGLVTSRQQVLPDLYAFTWGEYHIIPDDKAVLMRSLRFKAPASEMLSDNPQTFPVDAWMDD